MAYVAKDDLIVSIDGEFNFIQGTPQQYEITIFKDFIGNELNLSEPTSFHVGIYSGDDKAIQYSSPRTFGVSDILNIDLENNTGKIDFTIDDSQSVYIPSGDLYAEVSIIFENYYPQPKTYVFPKIKIGEAINDPNNPIGNPGGGDGGDNGDGGGDNSGGGSGNAATIYKNGTFTIESVQGDNPTSAGYVTVNSSTPGLVDSFIFTNLNNDGIRLVALENFLTKRISNEDINGIMTVIDTEPTNMYAIYKIDSWERIDITPGNGNTEDSDGIKVNVFLEARSSGPGVSKQTWEVGQKITFDLDAHGITENQILPTGILTYVDKNINPLQTSGNYQPTGITISYSPFQDSYVNIEVNGVSVELGDGLRDTSSYFSGDSGLTPARIEELRAGDELYWNGSFAGFDLEVGDEIKLIYEAKAEDLR
jgi:hypothetical protein